VQLIQVTGHGILRASVQTLITWELLHTIRKIFIEYHVRQGLGLFYDMVVRNEEALLRVKEQRNILHEISKRKAN
jgi:hypothetical protein